MRAGAVDIGTNTVRLLVADVDGARIEDVARRVVVVGLGRGLDRAGVISEESLAAADTVFSEYAHVLEETRPEAIRVVATSATRDATNSAELLESVEVRLGVAAEVISGDEEASMSFAGASAGLGGPRPLVVIDPGGGSTEFAVGDTEPAETLSIDIGSVRLTDRLLPERPAPTTALRRARRHVDDMFSVVSLGLEPALAVGVGGTFTSLAAIHLGLEAYDSAAVHGTVLPLDAIEGLIERMRPLTIEETAAIPSLDPARAPVILAGAVVAAAAVARIGLGKATVSEADLLEGIVLGLSGS